MNTSHTFSPRALRLLIAAAILAALALGLPWGRAGEEGEGFTTSGTLTIGMCSNYMDADGWMHTECGPTLWTPGYHFPGSTGSTIGARLTVRVFIIGGAATVAAGALRRDRRLLRAAPVVAGIGMFAGGIGSGPGFAAGVGSVLLLAMALAHDGHLRLPERLGRAGRPSTTI